jgi:steroid delta-isomerase-like uncharacterized protein
MTPAIARITSPAEREWLIQQKSHRRSIRAAVTPARLLTRVHPRKLWIFLMECRNHSRPGVYIPNGNVSRITPQRNAPMVTNAERDIANAKRLIEEVINTGHPELCDRYLAANRMDHQDYGLPPGAANGHDGFRRVLGGFLDAFPDLRLEVQFVIADGDRVVFYISTTGTHRGSLLGMAPTGKAFKVNGVDIFRFNDEGKISEHWGVFDTFGMLAQLGLGPLAQE